MDAPATTTNSQKIFLSDQFISLINLEPRTVQYHIFTPFTKEEFLHVVDVLKIR